MTKTNRIVGICLVRNEERFLDLVLSNIIDFCDLVFIADNKSTDSTPEIAKSWAEKHSTVKVIKIVHPAESHEILMQFVNTPTWVFAVDGDEVYDPEGLAKIKTELLSGRHDSYWRIIGNVLNCTELDTENAKARGYLSPPSRSITKLFNFNAITDWSGVKGERLHGGVISFKGGYSDNRCFRLHEEISWDESVFRCLHLCFMPRSGKDGKPKNGITTRWNLAEQQGKGLLNYLFAKALNFIGVTKSSGWKMEKYGRGEVVSKDVVPFLSFCSKKNGTTQFN